MFYEALASSLVIIKTLLSNKTMNEGTATCSNNVVKPEFSDQLEYPFQYDEKICRICCEYGDVSIFDDLAGRTIAHHINTFSQLRLSPADDYPKWICESCIGLVRNVLRFRELCESSNNKLMLIKLQQLDSRSDQLEYQRAKTEEVNSTLNLIDITIKTDIGAEEDVFADVESSPPQFASLSREASPPRASSPEQDEGRWSSSVPTIRVKNLPKLEEYRKRLFPRSERPASVRPPAPVRPPGPVRPPAPPRHLKNYIVPPRRQKTYNVPPQRVRQRKKEKGSYLCEVCGKSMANTNSLISHRTTHQNVFPFKCDQCPYRGRTKDLLKVHARTHLAVRPFACPKCPLRFLTASNLGKHKKQHEEPSPEQCPQCGKTFANKASLARHMSHIHTECPPVCCDICGRKYTRQSNMHKHRMKAHNIKPVRSGRWPSYLLYQAEQSRSTER